MSYDASQEAIVTVEGTVHRLAPCDKHAPHATGESVRERGVVVQNPNGYRHDCAECAAGPEILEPLEGVTHD